METSFVIEILRTETTIEDVVCGFERIKLSTLPFDLFIIRQFIVLFTGVPDVCDLCTIQHDAR